MDNHETRNKTINTLADAAALSNVERPGYSIPTPGAPGLINIDSVNDNVGSEQGDIGHFGTTDDLTPTLQGTIEGGEAQVLRIYANGVQLGSTTVGEDGHWSFTPDTLEGGSKYAFEVVLKDPLTDEILVASETYTIITTASNGDNGDTASIPEVDGLWDDIGEQKGPIHNGDTTDDAQPAIFGKADPGSVVVIYDNGQPVGSVTTNDTGNWIFTPEIPLADGEHSITAAGLNADGKPGEQSPATDFIVDGTDTTPPAAATGLVLADDVGPIKGDIHNGDRTDDAKPTLSGQAEAGATVIVSDNGKQIGSAVVGDNGKWTFTPGTRLADGSHSFSTVVEDAAGNKSPASGAIGFTVDTSISAPEITNAYDDQGKIQGNVENGGLTDDIKPLLSGTGEPGSTVSITMDGPLSGRTHTIASVTVDSDGKWEYQFVGYQSLQSGDNVFHITATDSAGNSSTGSNYVLSLVGANADDATPPAAATGLVLADDVGPIKGDIHNGDRTDDAKPTLSGQAEAGATVIVSDNGKTIGSAVVGDDGKWTFTPETKLADGSHSFSTVVKDVAGNKSPASDAIGFTVDTHTDAPVIVGYLDDVGVRMGTVENGGRTDDSNGVLSGHAEAGSQISLTMWGPRGMRYSNVAHTVTDSDGNWHIQLSDGSRELGNRGNWTFQVTAADEAGNRASSDKFKVNYVASNHDDTTAPDATTHQVLADDVGPVKGDIHNGDRTDDAKPTLSGQAEAGTTVIVSDNGKAIGSAVVGGNGKWTFTPGTNLADGSHSFSTVVKDAAGNKSPASDAIGFIVDTGIEKPVITSAVDNAGVSTGEVLNQGTTDDTTPLLKGTAEAGSVVHISVGGNVSGGEIGSTVTDATGHWTFQVPDEFALHAANNRDQTPIGIWSQDAAGNVAGGDGFYLNVVPLDNGADTTPPAATTDQVLADDVGPHKGDIHSGDITDDAKPTLSGQAEAGTTVIVSDNGKQIGSSVVGNDGKWTFTPGTNLADGSHSFSTVVEDAAGNKSPTSAAIDFTVDTHADVPVIVDYLDDVGVRMGTVENGGRTDDSNGLLSGHAEAGSQISLTMWGPRGMRYSNVAHTVTDSDGNWHIQLSDGSRQLGTNGNWTFQVTAADEAGNSVSSDKFKVDYVTSNHDDITAPDAPTINSYYDDVGGSKGSDGNGGTTDDTKPELFGKAEADSVVKIFEGNTEIGSVKADSQGGWSYTTPELNDGKHTFTATATDAAGNTSVTSGGFVVNVDAVTIPDKPTLSYIFDNVQINHNVYGDNYAPPGDPYADLPMVNDLSPTLYGNGTANSTLHIYTNEGGTTMDTVKVGSDGSWTFTAQIGNGYNIWDGGIYLASWKIVPLDSNGNEVADHAYQSFDLWVNDITDYPYYSSLALQSAAVEPLHAVADVPNTDALTQPDAVNGVINLSALSPSEANAVAQSSMLNLHNGSEDTLALTLNDVLSHGQSDMFVSDGQQQLAVQGERGDTVELKLDDVQSQWQETGQSTIAGVTYEVYQQTENHAELFVQQGVELHQS